MYSNENTENFREFENIDEFDNIEEFENFNEFENLKKIEDFRTLEEFEKWAGEITKEYHILGRRAMNMIKLIMRMAKEYNDRKEQIRQLIESHNHMLHVRMFNTSPDIFTNCSNLMYNPIVTINEINYSIDCNRRLLDDLLQRIIDVINKYDRAAYLRNELMVESNTWDDGHIFARDLCYMERDHMKATYNEIFYAPASFKLYPTFASKQIARSAYGYDWESYCYKYGPVAVHRVQG